MNIISKKAFVACQKEVSNFTHHIFNYFNSSQTEMDDTIALKAFVMIDSYSSAKTFTTAKLYSLFYSYKLKKFKYVLGLLSKLRIELEMRNVSELQGFFAFNFFRGLVFLSRKQYSESTISFASTLSDILLGNYYSIYQVESFKRLLLLGNLVEQKIKLFIAYILKQHALLRGLQQVQIYEELSKLLSNKETPMKEVESYMKQNKIKFQSQKTKGLANLCVKNFVFSKIMNTVLVYRKVRLEKLMKLTELSRDSLVSHLKQLYHKNKLGVKIDEFRGIVEFDVDNIYDEKKLCEEIKSIITKVSSLNYELLEETIIIKSKASDMRGLNENE